MGGYSVCWSNRDECYYIEEYETGVECSFNGNLADIGATYREAEEIRRGYIITLNNPAIDYIHGIFHSQIDG